MYYGVALALFTAVPLTCCCPNNDPKTTLTMTQCGQEHSFTQYDQVPFQSGTLVPLLCFAQVAVVGRPNVGKSTLSHENMPRPNHNVALWSLAVPPTGCRRGTTQCGQERTLQPHGRHESGGRV
jgi:hypothetical protein